MTKEELHAQIDLTLTNRPLVNAEFEGRLEVVSSSLRAVGHTMVNVCPQSRELSLALTKLQEARMFAVAAIALHQEDIE